MGSFVPENVKNFILYFRRHVNEANVPGILSMYETMWPYEGPLSSHSPTLPFSPPRSALERCAACPPLPSARPPRRRSDGVSTIVLTVQATHGEVLPEGALAAAGRRRAAASGEG